MEQRSVIPEWDAARGRIAQAAFGDEADGIIDTTLARVREAMSSGVEDSGAFEAIGRVVLVALATARRALTRRDSMFAGVAIAVSSARLRADDVAARRRATEIVDAIASRAREWRHDAFLGPEALHALAVAAEEDPIARAEVQSALLRLDAGDERFLLVRAAKVVGRLESLGVATGVRAKLVEWEDVEDAAVQGEARTQQGILALLSAISATDWDAMRSGLRESALALQRAEATEEQRHDARVLMLLVDALFGATDRPDAHAEWSERVGHAASALRAGLVSSGRPWVGYASPLEDALEHRLLRVADGLKAMAASVREVDRWIRLDAALADVAAACALVTERDAWSLSGLPEALSAVEGLVVPRLGPLIEGSIGRTRMLAVVDDYVGRYDDDTAVLLRRLHETAVAASRADGSAHTAAVPSDMSSDDLRRLVDLTPGALAYVLRAAPGVRATLALAGYEVALREADHAELLPAHHSGLYGADPSVDRAIRPLLEEVWRRAGRRLSIAQWDCVREVLISLVGITRDLRDDRPSFTLRSDLGGMGQTASEADLQNHLLSRLRDRYGRAAVWEPSKTAGGRSDIGVQFSQCAIPIEVKAEYRDVSAEHVRANYLAQADEYAAVRDDVSVLMILDLRAENADGEVVEDNEADGETVRRYSLYSLRDSFWVDGLAVDPHLAAAPKVVVVGLVPGNRPKPSATTTYSRRPRAARRTRR